MRLPIAGALVALVLAGCGAKPAAQVDGAWIRLPAVAGRPGAAYFTLTAGQQPLTLQSVTTSAAARSELHESMKSGAMMTMKPLTQADVPAGTTLAFAPGGRHVMLYALNPALKAGATTTLTLAFADGTTIDAKAEVRGAGDAAP